MIGDELPQSILQSCIDWMRDNMNPDEVFDITELVRFISNAKMPDEVFSEQELARWAIEKGYTAPPKTETQLFIDKVLNNI